MAPSLYLRTCHFGDNNATLSHYDVDVVYTGQRSVGRTPDGRARLESLDSAATATSFSPLDVVRNTRTRARFLLQIALAFSWPDLHAKKNGDCVGSMSLPQKFVLTCKVNLNQFCTYLQ